MQQGLLENLGKHTVQDRKSRSYESKPQRVALRVSPLVVFRENY